MFKIQHERWHLIPVILLIFQSLAFGKSLPWDLLPFELGRWAWLVLTLGFLFWLVYFQSPLDENIFEWLLKRKFLVCWTLLNYVYIAYNGFKFHSLGYEIPYFLVICLSLSMFYIDETRLELSLFVNLMILFFSIIYYPINVDRSDMLPVITKGLDNWSTGKSPYEEFVLNGLPKTMGYLPGALFMHFPAWILGLDLRWNNFIYRAAWLSFLCYQTKKNCRSDLKATFHYLALSPYINFRHDLYFEGYLLLLSLYFSLVRLRFLSLPLMALTRQWAWVLSPFLILNELKPLGPENCFRKILGFGIGTLFVGGLFIELLTANTSLNFFLEKIFWFNKAYQSEAYGGDYGFGLSWLFYKLEIQKSLMRL